MVGITKESEQSLLKTILFESNNFVQVAKDPRRLIVLDDDPTGCQTVYDVVLLLDYSVSAIKQQVSLFNLSLIATA